MDLDLDDRDITWVDIRKFKVRCTTASPISVFEYTYTDETGTPHTYTCEDGFDFHRPRGVEWTNCQIAFPVPDPIFSSDKYSRFWRVKGKAVDIALDTQDDWLYAEVTNMEIQCFAHPDGNDMSWGGDPLVDDPVRSARRFVDTYGSDIDAIIENSRDARNKWKTEHADDYADEDLLDYMSKNIVETPMMNALAWRDECVYFDEHMHKWGSLEGEDEDEVFLLRTIMDFAMIEELGAARTWLTMNRIPTTTHDPVGEINRCLGRKQASFVHLPLILQQYTPILRGSILRKTIERLLRERNLETEKTQKRRKRRKTSNGMLHIRW